MYNTKENAFDVCVYVCLYKKRPLSPIISHAYKCNAHTFYYSEWKESMLYIIKFALNNIMLFIYIIHI